VCALVTCSGLARGLRGLGVLVGMLAVREALGPLLPTSYRKAAPRTHRLAAVYTDGGGGDVVSGIADTAGHTATARGAHHGHGGGAVDAFRPAGYGAWSAACRAV
jgi:hypothetical protein